MWPFRDRKSVHDPEDEEGGRDMTSEGREIVARTEGGVGVVKHYDPQRETDRAVNDLESTLEIVSRVAQRLAQEAEEVAEDDSEEIGALVRAERQEEREALDQLPARINETVNSVRAQVVGNRLGARKAVLGLAAVVSQAPSPLDENGVQMIVLDPNYAARWFLDYAAWHARAEQASMAAQTQADDGIKR